MSRTYTPLDAHLIMGLLVKEATGQDSTVQIVDTSSFVSAGETVLATGVENTLNAIGVVMGRTLMGVRPYQAKLALINALNTGAYTSRLRKISFYSRDAQASGYFNTDKFPDNLKDGETNVQNSTKTNTESMWLQNQPIPLEVNFGGTSTWQDSTSIYQKQLRAAFRGEGEFMEFMSGIMTEKGNDIESQKEAFNRMTLLNKIAGVYDLGQSSPGSVINLTAEFNNEFGTSYTSAELRSTYLKEFLAFFIARFKIESDYMTERTARYHYAPDKDGHVLLRHTPKDKQRAILFSPMFTKAEAYVLPEIFHDGYLKKENYEGITFWQNINNPSAISVTPAIPTAAGTQTAGNPVNIPYVLGILYDADGIMTDFQLEEVLSTPIEARKGYSNIWWTFAKNSINDFTENAIIFIMQDA